MTTVFFAAPAVADHSLWNQPLGSATLTALLGFGLLAVSIPIVLNWRRAAESYSRLVDGMTPRLPRARFLPAVDEDARWQRLVLQSRVIFTVIGLFGIAFFAGGLVSLLRHL